LGRLDRFLRRQLFRPGCFFAHRLQFSAKSGQIRFKACPELLHFLVQPPVFHLRPIQFLDPAAMLLPKQGVLVLEALNLLLGGLVTVGQILQQGIALLLDLTAEFELVLEFLDLLDEIVPARFQQAGLGHELVPLLHDAVQLPAGVGNDPGPFLFGLGGDDLVDGSADEFQDRALVQHLDVPNPPLGEIVKRRVLGAFIDGLLDVEFCFVCHPMLLFSASIVRTPGESRNALDAPPHAG
jgi:hypothetical protein